MHIPFIRNPPREAPARSEMVSRSALGLQEYLEQTMVYNNHAYSYGYSPSISGSVEEITGDFSGFARGAFMANPAVFACMEVRKSLFSEARFKYRRLRSGRPGDLYGNPDLGILEQPWPNGTTGDLLARMEQDNSLAGNFYARVTRTGLDRMRPDWVTIILGSQLEPDEANLQMDAQVIGYAYYPGGPKAGVKPQLLDVSEVVHYAPTPDPEARFRGVSWLVSLVRQIQSHNGYTDHQLKFIAAGATNNLIMLIDKEVTIANAKAFEESYREKYEGLANRFKTLFVGGGATPMVVGSNFQEMDMKALIGASETLIAAAAGVPPVIVGLSEGLQGSSLNEGNYAMARRRFADITMRPLWRNAAASLAKAVPIPSDAELWYDDRDISALQEDAKDDAEIMQFKADAMKTWADAGYTRESCIAAISADDVTLLIPDPDFVSVQLQARAPLLAPTELSTNGAVPVMRALTDKITEFATEGASA